MLDKSSKEDGIVVVSGSVVVGGGGEVCLREKVRNTGMQRMRDAR
jgi:hypothetical protein